MKHKIPFMIELRNGNYETAPVRFKSGRIVALKYQFMCRADKTRIYCFRTARDAQLAARHNGWTYLGKG